VADESIINWAATRASDDPAFLGYDLREYSKVNGLDEVALAQFLECSKDSLVKLALCLHPSPALDSFRDNVERIAFHCAANAQRLAQLIREVDSVQAMRSAPPFQIPQRHGQSAVVLAARDRIGPLHRKQKRKAKKRKRPKSK
jgi:hypothetical protein